MLENLIFLIFSFLCSINGMDIRLSLGKKIEGKDNIYPVIISLKEPLIYQYNPVDLICICDVSSSMNQNNKTIHLKNALNLTIDALNENDRISLISFSFSHQIRFPLSYLTPENKEKAKKVVYDLVANGNATNFTEGVIGLVKTIVEKTEKDDGRVKSIIFLTDGENYATAKNSSLVLANLLTKYKEKYDFTINSFGFNYRSVPKNLVEMSDKRDGAFYSINDTQMEKIKDYVLNVVGAMNIL